MKSASSTLCTTYAWRIQFAEDPAPVPRRRISVCRVSERRGLLALESMIRDGLPVGPVLVCPFHGLVHVPVDGRDGCPMLRRTLAPGCDELGYQQGRHGRIWMWPRGADTDTLTDFPVFFDRLHRVPADLECWSAAA